MNYQSAKWRRALARKVLTWFDRSARDLPWRRTQDLYAIWISEVMLQQTQVTTVIPYWKRFLARFPDVTSLAVADEREVLRLWEGLGYYRRARQLHAAAKQILALHEGRFPTTVEAVRALPGIGRYTAGAVLSIGLDQRLPILEANTIRVLSRLTAFDGAPSSAAGRKQLWAVAADILPAKRCGTVNQALMELGSEICTAKSPACDQCPVAKFCAAHCRGLASQIPRAPKPTIFEAVTEVAVVVRHRGRVLLRHCQPGERWAGLWDFPRFGTDSQDVKDSGSLRARIVAGTRQLVGVEVVVGERLTTLKHGVTRFRITLHCFEAALQGRNVKTLGGRYDALRWVVPEELADYPLSTTGRKISRLLIANSRRENDQTALRGREQRR